MNNSSLSSLNFLENKYLKIVSAGEIHKLYLNDELNVAHTWLNLEIIMNAYLIVEDLMFEYGDSFKSIIPRYFDKNNVFSADDIRETCFLISEELNDNKSISFHIRNFLSDYVLSHKNFTQKKEKVDTRNIKNNVALKNVKKMVASMNINNKKFMIFIKESKDANNIFNMFFGDEINTNNDYHQLEKTYNEIVAEASIVESSIADKNPSIYMYIGYNVNFESKNQNHLKLLFIYEVLLLSYMIENFIQRVAKWCVKHNNKLTYSAIYDTLRYFLYSEYEYSSLLLIFAMIYDFTAIFKILDLYDEEKEKNNSASSSSISQKKKLIWLCSGAAHNEKINEITKRIFIMIEDPYENIKEFIGILHTVNYQSKSEKINSEAFKSYVLDNPDYGFKPPTDPNFDIMVDDKNNLIQNFINYIKTNYHSFLLNHIKLQDVESILNLLPLINLQCMITIILNKDLFLYNEELLDYYYKKMQDKLKLSKEALIDYKIFVLDPNINKYKLNKTLWSLYQIPAYYVGSSIPTYTLDIFLKDTKNLQLNDSNIIVNDLEKMRNPSLLKFIEEKRIPDEIFDYNKYLELENEYNLTLDIEFKKKLELEKENNKEKYANLSLEDKQKNIQKQKESYISKINLNHEEWRDIILKKKMDENIKNDIISKIAASKIYDLGILDKTTNYFLEQLNNKDYSEIICIYIKYCDKICDTIDTIMSDIRNVISIKSIRKHKEKLLNTIDDDYDYLTKLEIRKANEQILTTKERIGGNSIKIDTICNIIHMSLNVFLILILIYIIYKICEEVAYRNYLLSNQSCALNHPSEPIFKYELIS